MSSTSPDQHAKGFAVAAVDPLRYEGHTSDPDEAAGMIAGLLPPNKRVLDVGCGTGSMPRLLVDLRGVKLVGIEPDLDRVQKARARGLDVRHGILDEATAKELGLFDKRPELQVRSITNIFCGGGFVRGAGDCR